MNIYSPYTAYNDLGIYSPNQSYNQFGNLFGGAGSSSGRTGGTTGMGLSSGMTQQGTGASYTPELFKYTAPAASGTTSQTQSPVTGAGTATPTGTPTGTPPTSPTAITPTTPGTTSTASDVVNKILAGLQGYHISMTDYQKKDWDPSGYPYSLIAGASTRQDKTLGEINTLKSRLTDSDWTSLRNLYKQDLQSSSDWWNNLTSGQQKWWVGEEGGLLNDPTAKNTSYSLFPSSDGGYTTDPTYYNSEEGQKTQQEALKKYLNL